MSAAEHPRSFSAGRRWGIFFSVVISIAAFAAIIVMLNYLGARHSLRFYLARNSRQLSPMTVKLVQSLTNDVKIIVYYDSNDPLYEEISELLKEYSSLNNPHLSVEKVDWYLNSEGAQKVRMTYHLGGDVNKNVIIVASGDKQPMIIPGERLASSKVEETAAEMPAEGTNSKPVRNFVRHLDMFQGETIIDAFLVSVTSKKPYLACYTVDHSEPSLTDDDSSGYQEFRMALAGCNVVPVQISLAGTNDIPDVCSLLIIAGPVSPGFNRQELAKISAFLAHGGRLLVLFNWAGSHTGLEPLLADWGVEVDDDVVTDPDATVSEDSTAHMGSIMVNQFNPKHPLVNSLVGSRLHIFQPRSIRARQMSGNNPPTVTELAWTGERGRMSGNIGGMYPPGHVPVMAAVEKSVGVGAAAKGETRIVVAGDSVFLENSPMADSDNANEDFARAAVDWLLGAETPTLQSVGPRRVLEYKLNMTHAELTTIRWIFLAGMPGGILLFGSLVWLRRRR